MTANNKKRPERWTPIKIIKKRILHKHGHVVHIDESTYSGLNYKARFVHKKLGEFWSTPNNFLNQKHAHPKISDLSKIIPLEIAVKRFKDQKRKDIVLNENSYISFRRKAEFIDKDYGSWFAVPQTVLAQKTKHPQRQRDELSKKLTVSLQEAKKLLKEAHRNKVSIKESTYKNFTTKCIFIDKELGEWEAIPDNVIRQKTRHPARKRNSKKEKIVLSFVKQYFPSAKPHFVGKIIKGKHRTGYYLDIFVPELNKGIEFNGTYWHSFEVLKRKRSNGWTISEIKNYHEDKRKHFAKHGIKYLNIQEKEWDKNKSKCLTYILKFLGTLND